jgi:hypothetical protein
MLEDFSAQRAFVESRSPSYHRLLGFLEETLNVGLGARLEKAWQRRKFGAFYERPLLVLAALRDDALKVGKAHPLWAAIAAPHPDAEIMDATRVSEALGSAHFWETIRKRFVQTNESARAVAWLWPGHLAFEAGNKKPLCIVDVGASAGLNLIADELEGGWTLVEGGPLQVSPRAPVKRRLGFDLRPLDVNKDDDARWLQACVWPGQGEREARLLKAIEVFRGQGQGVNGPTLEKAGAEEIPQRLSHLDDDQLVLVYQTIMRDYVPDKEWQSYEKGLRAWLQKRPRGSALWVELEVTDEARSGGPPAALTAHARGETGIESHRLATCEPHPEKLDVDGAAVRAWCRAISL